MTDDIETPATPYGVIGHTPEPLGVMRLNCLNLPADAWELLSAHAKVSSPFPPAKTGRSSVILQLLRKVQPPAGAEAIYESLYGGTHKDVNARKP